MTKPSHSEVNGNPSGLTGPEEVASLREQVAHLRAEYRTLQEQATIWKKERDEYLRAFFSMLPPCEVSFTPEELADLEKNGGGIEDILRDLDPLEAKPG